LLPDAWNVLGRVRRNLAIHFLRFLFFKNKFQRLPVIFRLALLHAIITLVNLVMMPPAQTVPPIMVPILWIASLCVAITVYSVAPLITYRLLK
jgi:hypothetical protein